jgi:hypothetical protein
MRAPSGCGMLPRSTHHLPGKPKIELDPSRLLGFDQAAALAAKVGAKPADGPPGGRS